MQHRAVIYVRFEVLTEVTVKITVLRDVMTCSPVGTGKKMLPAASTNRVGDFVLGFMGSCPRRQ
jgi:hypothetical protein